MHPDEMTVDDRDQLYYDCESNGEGEPRSMVQYAYIAGWDAAWTKAEQEIAELREMHRKVLERRS